eukprot:7929009-Ditylum_brightwellii.AAC.1
MTINLRNLERTNQTMANKLAPIPFFVTKNKLSPLDYQVYKLRTNPKNERSAVYSLTVGIYKVETPEEWL